MGIMEMERKWNPLGQPQLVCKWDFGPSGSIQSVGGQEKPGSEPVSIRGMILQVGIAPTLTSPWPKLVTDNTRTNQGLSG